MSVTQGSGVTLQPGVSAGADDRVATPVFSPAAGAYGPAQNVTITCSTPGASIKYTTDGSTPSPSHGTAYTVPVAIAATATLKALAYDGVLPNSAVRTGVYTIGGTVATPVITLAAGTYDNDQTTTLTCATAGAAIHYTVDGSAPTTLSPLYSVALNITSSRTIKAKAFKTGYTSSATASSVFVLQVATPTFDPVAGSYSGTQSVTIATATSGAALRYSLVSSTGPWTAYTVPVDVSTSATLYAYGTKAGYSDSSVGSAVYVIVLGPSPANMVGWYRKGIGQTDAGGGACSAWADQSGLGHDLVQTVGANYPAIQGDGTLLFDGLTSTLRVAFTLTQPETVYLRMKLPTVPAVGTNRYAHDGTSSDGTLYFVPGSLVPQSYAGGFSGPSGAALVIDTYTSVAHVINGAASVIQVDATSSAPGDSGALDMGGVALGGSGNNVDDKLNVQIAEAIVYNVAHDATQRAAIIAYLNTVI